MNRYLKFWPAFLVAWLGYESISRKIQNTNMEESFKSELHNTVSKHERQIEVLGAGISLDNQQKRAILVVESIIHDVNPKLKQEDGFAFAKAIVEESKKYSEFDYIDLTSLIAHESTFNPKNVSPAGAKGFGMLMDDATQFSCERLRIPCHDSSAFNPIVNIKLTAYYLSWCIASRQSKELGLAQYNGGQRQAWRFSCKKKKLANKTLDSLEEVGVVNLSEETWKYVPQIEKNIAIFTSIANNFMPELSPKVAFKKPDPKASEKVSLVAAE